MLEENIKHYSNRWRHMQKAQLQEAVFDALALSNFMRSPQGKHVFDSIWTQLHTSIFKIVDYCLAGTSENQEKIEKTALEINILHDALKRWSDILEQGDQE